MQTVMHAEPLRSESPRILEQSVPRRFASTPLQNSQVSSPITASSAQSSPRDLASPTSSRGGSGVSYSPRSPPLTAPLPGSPAGSRKGDYLRMPARSNSDDGSPVDAVSKSSPLATPRADNQRQIRNVSAPLSEASAGGSVSSPPHSPSDAGTVRGKPTSLGRVDQRLAPRNSSIDSTLSSTSSTTNLSQVSGDPTSPNPAEIAQMIAQAGSAEAVISFLVKARKQAANQNEQLFRLVQKQRSLIHGLSQDLEKAVKEREKYRQRLRDESEHMSPARDAKVDALRRDSPGGSSATVSEDELPIQRHSAADDEPKPSSAAKSRANAPRADSDTIRTTMTKITAKKPSPPKEDLGEFADDESRRNTMVHSPIAPVAPLMINKRSDTSKSEEEAIGGHNAQSPASFAARRSFPRKTSNAMPTSGTQSPTEAQAVSPSTRKGPPARLNLGGAPSDPAQSPKSPEDYGPEDHSGSEYDIDELDDVTGLPRGRKKTREEDDREREIMIQHEHESRSLSKKQAGSKSGSKGGSAHAKDSDLLDPSMHPLPKSPAAQGFAPVSPGVASLRGHLSAHASIAGMLSGPPSSHSSVSEKRTIISLPPTSPGLPLSPRPVDRPMGAPAPRQPRDGYITSPPPSAGLPKSPSPLQQPAASMPPPPRSPAAASYSSGPKSPTQLTMDPPQSPTLEEQAPTSPVTQPKSPLAPPKSPRKLSDPISVSSSSSVPQELYAEGVFRGLVSEEYPRLLLPPKGLSTIAIKVTSSRLKPSRHSMIMMGSGPQEEPVFTLGIIARSNSWQLWRVEKPILSLPQLDYELRHVMDMDIKLPDRSLFSGHAPAKIDARREALETYFAALLEMQMNDQAAMIMCKYFSTNVIPAEDPDHQHATAPANQPTLPLDAEGRIYKEGYLTKRGKQFGGWKARFFVLEDSVLRYYDGPGGSLQGTIKLFNAQIGRQSTHASSSPSRDGQNADNQFRHAFLILEPKKRDANSHMRHVLCAESDEERDEWVYALLQYVNILPDETKLRSASKGNDATSKQALKATTPKRSEDNLPMTESDPLDSLQGVSYEDTAPGVAPILIDTLPSREPASPVAANGGYMNLHINTALPTPTISRPTNGAVIQDAASWGNRPADVAKKEKEQKKRSIWGFRDRFTDATGAANVSPASAAPKTPHSARRDNRVFGLPLREAVEYCIAPGSNICLPAVVYRCIEYLDANNASSEEGIYRLSGSNLVIKQLKEKFDTDGDFDILADEENYWDVHAVASLLKLYLRELPTTVLTRELNPLFVDALDIDDKEERLRIYNSLVHKLPLPNWTLVRAISRHLLTIINNHLVNKMSVRNVGIVFAPTLNIPAPVLSAFLTDYESIFESEPAPSAVSSHAPHVFSEDMRPSTAPTPSEQQFNHRPEAPYVQPGGRQTPVQNGYAQAAPHGRSTPVQPVQYSTMPHPSPRQPYAPDMGRSTHQGSPARQGSLPTQLMASRQGSLSAQPVQPFSQPREMAADRASIMGRPSYETHLSFEPPGAPTGRGATHHQQQQQQPHPSFSYTRPSYETHVSFEPSRVPPPAGPPPAPPSGLHERPKYASGLGVTELMRDAKSRRRESSLLVMGGGPAAKRKSSMPTIGNMPESVAE